MFKFSKQGPEFFERAALRELSESEKDMREESTVQEKTDDAMSNIIYS